MQLKPSGVRTWLHTQFQSRFRDLTDAGGFAAQGLFDPSGVKALLLANREGRVDAAYPLLAVLCIESWCRQFRGHV